MFLLFRKIFSIENVAKHFLVNLAQKSQSEETSNFSPKSCTSPFAKKAKKKLFSIKIYRQTLFTINLGEKKSQGRNFKFQTKVMD